MLDRSLAVRWLLPTLIFMLCACPEPVIEDDAGPRRDVGRTVERPDSGWHFVPFDAGPPPPEGSLEGQLVEPDGSPATGVDLLCCDDSTCLIDTTDAEGRYTYTDIPIGSRKMKTYDPDGRYRATLFHQLVSEEVVTGLRRPVVMFPKGTRSPWTGGTVVLAGGRLELTAPAEGMIFAGAEIDEQGTCQSGCEISALEVTPAEFPPPDLDPWADDSSGTLSFVFEPSHVHTDGRIGMKVLLGEPGRVGETYQIWTVDDNTALVSQAGQATIDAAGNLTADADAQLKSLDGLILVPIPD